MRSLISSKATSCSERTLLAQSWKGEVGLLSADSIAANIGRISSIFSTRLDIKACKKALFTSVYPFRSRLIVRF